MARFLVEVPHEAEEKACALAIQLLLRTGSHYLTNAEWGCMDRITSYNVCYTKLLRENWSPTGEIDIAARLEPAVGGSRVAARAAFGKIGFSSPAGDVLGQNLAGRVELEALLTRQPRVKADLIVRQGEALWGTVYVDLTKVPLDLHAGGTRAGPEEYQDLV